MERREFSFVVADGHVRLISVGNAQELLHADTRNFTGQELGSVLVRAMKLRCARSDAEQAAAALDDIPLQERGSASCWAIIDRFMHAVLRNERWGAEPGDHYQDYIKARDELADAMQ